MFSLQTTSGVSLRVEFARQGDRFGHVISVVDGGTEQAIARSIEGTDADVWPASPPVQEVHQQGDVLFLTGMAGGSYWSASVSVESPGAILFDVACRVKSLPEYLGARYKIEPGASGSIQWEPVEAGIERNADVVSVRPTELRPQGSVRWRYRIALA